MLTIIETPHRGPEREWIASSWEEFAVKVLEAHATSGSLDPSWSPEQIRLWLASDLRSLEIIEF